MSLENVRIVRGVYEALGKGEVPTAVAHMDQGIEWNEAENFLYADGNPYIGPQAVLEGVFMRLGADWEEFAVMPAEWLDAGDRIMVLGIYTGLHKVTGRRVRAQFAHIWNVSGSKVVKFQQYTDTKQFADIVAG